MNIVLSPHTDDGELGCGGSLHKMGGFVNVAFSWCDNKELIQECRKSNEHLNVDSVDILDFERRMFLCKRQEILDVMVGLREKYNPEMVFIPSLTDTHQDHKVIAEEAVRAFRCNVLGYELPRNNTNFSPNFFIELSVDDAMNKLKALGEYKSQRGKSYFEHDSIMSILYFRGMQAGTKFSEAFECIRWIN